MPRSEQKRSVRVAERVRAEVMELLLRGAIRDPRVKDVLVSEVRVTDDLGTPGSTCARSSPPTRSGAWRW
jgi:ribosome-binding factor A